MTPDPSVNIYGEPLVLCGTDPLTGFFRDGHCNTCAADQGSHTVCAVMTAEFLAYSKYVGNDLSCPCLFWRPMMPASNAAAVMGALVADAAAMGLHWIYDPARIAEVAGNGSAAFVPPDARNFENVMAFFAHGARHTGDFSHNLLAEQTDSSGVEDDQHPAVATLPAIVARYHGAADLDAQVRAAIQVTNTAPDALKYGTLFAHTLHSLLDGIPLAAALERAAADDPLLNAALTAQETDSVAYGAITQRACHLNQGMPLSFHILSNATSYADAIERNIRAGGDSCGRAMIVGALAGAAWGMDAIPLDWTLSLTHSAQVWQDVCDALA